MNPQGTPPGDDTVDHDSDHPSVGAGHDPAGHDDIDHDADEAVREESATQAPRVDAADLAGAVEAVLFVLEAPVTLASLAVAFQQPVDAVSAAVAALREGYEQRGAGIELRDVAGGVRLYTRPAYADAVAAFLMEGQRSRLTQAALETLAVVAYRQPVTRSRVSAIRGVNVDGVVRTLVTRGLLVEAGADSETGGALLRTTDAFLEKMGLPSLADLPSLAPLLPELDHAEIDESYSGG